MQATDLLAPYIGAGGIAGIGDEDQAGALVHQLQKLVHIDAVVRLRRIEHLRLAGPRANCIGAEGEFALNDVVAGLQIGLAEHVEDLVRAAAEDQPLRLQPEGLGDGVAQGRGAAVGIDMQLVDGRGEGGLGLGAAAQDVLIGRQLQRMRDPVDLGLAGDIGGDVEDARLGNRTVGGGAIGGLGHG